MTARSGYQEHPDGTLTPLGLRKREGHIQAIEDLNRAIRRRNEQIAALQAQVTEYAAQLRESTVGSALNQLSDQLGLGAPDAAKALEIGAQLLVQGLTVEEIEDARARIINPTGWDTNRSLRSEHTARAALRDLQERIGRANAEKGFHEEGDAARASAQAASEGASIYADDERIAMVGPVTLRNYYTARLALITTEVAEAVEELRNGRQVDETYYPTAPLGGNAIHETGAPAKPEGVPSELADVVIRSFDFAHEAGIDLAAMIEEKISYNATRARKHGREF